MSASVLSLALIGAVALGLLGWAIGLFNAFVTVRNNVTRAWKNIDVVLQQRNDELSKLIDTCRAYMTHEQSLLNQLTQLRTGYTMAREVEEKVGIENQMARLLGQLRTVWEQYPDLKAVQSFLQVQTRVSGVESKIADYREAFNDAVNIYNIQIERFPDLILAAALRYKRHSFLEVPEEKKADVRMRFAS
jgi:LemA protein